MKKIPKAICHKCAHCLMIDSRNGVMCEHFSRNVTTTKPKYCTNFQKLKKGGEE